MQSFVIATRENGRFASASNSDFRGIFADVALQSLIRETQRAVAQFDRQPKPFAAPIKPLRLYSESRRGLANGEQPIFLIRLLERREFEQANAASKAPCAAPHCARSVEIISGDNLRARKGSRDRSSSVISTASTRPTCILYPPFDSHSWSRCGAHGQGSQFRTLLRMTPCDGAAIYLVRACARADYR